MMGLEFDACWILSQIDEDEYLVTEMRLLRYISISFFLLEERSCLI